MRIIFLITIVKNVSQSGISSDNLTACIRKGQLTGESLLKIFVKKAPIGQRVLIWVNKVILGGVRLVFDFFASPGRL